MNLSVIVFSLYPLAFYNTKVDILYVDFMKAFDTVPHERFLYEICGYLIKDPLHGWIRS